MPPAVACTTVASPPSLVGAVCGANTVTLDFDVFVPLLVGEEFYCRFRLDYGCTAQRVTWYFFGRAWGGQNDFVIAGVAITVVTSAGQTAEDVAAAVEAAINGNAQLAGAGIFAVVTGNEVATNGHVSEVEIQDPGLLHGDIPIIPTPGAPMLIVLSLLLVSAAFTVLRRSRKPPATRLTPGGP